MNLFEIIVQKEKDLSYSQRNKDLLSYYILTLIEQEQAYRKLKRELGVFLAISLVSIASLLFSPIFSPINDLVNHLLNILGLATVSYGLLFALITLLMEQSPTNLN
jgi:hypothetical protein